MPRLGEVRMPDHSDKSSLRGKSRGREGRTVIEELREMRDIARREHGPGERSVRHIEAFLEAEEQSRNQVPAEERR